MKWKMLTSMTTLSTLTIVLVSLLTPTDSQGSTLALCANKTNGNLRLVSGEADCRESENFVSIDLTGSPGPAGPAGSPGPAGPAGEVGPVFLNRNFQNVALAPFPGVTTAALSLPPGSYMMFAKFRYRGNEAAGSHEKKASCVFEGTGIGGLVSAEQQLI